MKTSNSPVSVVSKVVVATLSLFVLSLAAHAGIPQGERDALLALYASTGGPECSAYISWSPVQTRKESEPKGFAPFSFLRQSARRTLARSRHLPTRRSGR